MNWELVIRDKSLLVIGSIESTKTQNLNFNSRRRKKQDSTMILLHHEEEAEQSDTILVDYLVGAMDKFSASAYFQDVIFERLNTHLRPGGKLLILGMEPISDDNDGVAKITTDIKHAQDACQLLAGERPYREYPLSWIERSLALARVDGLTVASIHMKKVGGTD